MSDPNDQGESRPTSLRAIYRLLGEKATAGRNFVKNLVGRAGATQTNQPRGSSRLFRLAIAMALLLVFLSIAGYYTRRLTRPTAEFVLQAAGVLATVFLVAAYLGLLEQTTRQETRERYEPLVRDLVSDVIEPATQAVTSNKNIFVTGAESKLTYETLWLSCDQLSDAFQPLTYGLGASDAQYRLLEELNPGLYTQMGVHDKKLRRLYDQGRSVELTLRDSLDEYLSEAVDHWDPKPDVLLVALLNDSSPPPEDRHLNDWLEHRDEISQIAAEEYGDVVEETKEMREEYIDFADELHESLLEFWLWLQANPNALAEVKFGPPESLTEAE